MNSWLSISILFFVSLSADADEALTMRENLLHDYFDSASVCATADIISITDEKSTITIDLQIESKTSRGLVKLESEKKDDWFSLHCPPESNPVWRAGSQPADIRVRGILADNTVHQLSCLRYQAQLYQRISDAKNRVDKRLNELLSQ